jgi:hypothetical protein
MWKCDAGAGAFNCLFGVAKFALSLFSLAMLQCSSTVSNGGKCSTGDQDGVTSGPGLYSVLMTVSDTGFAVGGIDSGSVETTITAQNLGNIMLTLTNTGTKPHDLKIGCVPTGLPAGCPATSCFPLAANIGTLAPGASMSTTFVTPAVEGDYQFVSDEPGDAETLSDGGTTGVVGDFVLM